MQNLKTFKKFNEANFNDRPDFDSSGPPMDRPDFDSSGPYQIVPIESLHGSDFLDILMYSFETEIHFEESMDFHGKVAFFKFNTPIDLTDTESLGDSIHYDFSNISSEYVLEDDFVSSTEFVEPIGEEIDGVVSETLGFIPFLYVTNIVNLDDLEDELKN